MAVETGQTPGNSLEGFMRFPEKGHSRFGYLRRQQEVQSRANDSLTEQSPESNPPEQFSF